MAQEEQNLKDDSASAEASADEVKKELELAKAK